MANRQRVETEDLIGYFVNTVVMRTDFPRNRLFARCSACPGDHAGRLREPGRAVRESDRWSGATSPEEPAPPIQALFVLLNAPRETFAAPELTAEIVEVETGATQFDLVVELVEQPEQMVLRLAYRTDLFHAATARRMSGLPDRAAGRDLEILKNNHALPLLTEPERQELLVD